MGADTARMPDHDAADLVAYTERDAAITTAMVEEMAAERAAGKRAALIALLREAVAYGRLEWTPAGSLATAGNGDELFWGWSDLITPQVDEARYVFQVISSRRLADDDEGFDVPATMLVVPSTTVVTLAQHAGEEPSHVVSVEPMAEPDTCVFDRTDDSIVDNGDGTFSYEVFSTSDVTAALARRVHELTGVQVPVSYERHLLDRPQYRCC